MSEIPSGKIDAALLAIQGSQSHPRTRVQLEADVVIYMLEQGLITLALRAEGQQRIEAMK